MLSHCSAQDRNLVKSLRYDSQFYKTAAAFEMYGRWFSLLIPIHFGNKFHVGFRSKIQDSQGSTYVLPALLDCLAFCENVALAPAAV